MLEPAMPLPMMTTLAELCMMILKNVLCFDSTQPLLKLWGGHVTQEARQVVVSVLAIIKIERGNAELEKTPERLAQVRTKPHQMQVRQIGWPRLTKIGAQKQFALLLVQRLVDGKVAQIKKEIAHA